MSNNCFTGKRELIQGMKVLYYTEYYQNETIRALCHAMKNGDCKIEKDIIFLYKKLLKNNINKEAILTAMPGHDGKINKYMERIVKILAKELTIRCNCDLRITPLEDTLYNIKKRGEEIPKREVIAGPNSNDNIVLIDNVIDTGNTVKVINSTYRNITVAVLAITENTLIKNKTHNSNKGRCKTR